MINREISLSQADTNQRFSYNSGNNEQWETVETLRQLIKEYVDPNFELIK